MPINQLSPKKETLFISLKCSLESVWLPEWQGQAPFLPNSQQKSHQKMWGTWLGLFFAGALPGSHFPVCAVYRIIHHLVAPRAHGGSPVVLPPLEEQQVGRMSPLALAANHQEWISNVGVLAHGSAPALTTEIAVTHCGLCLSTQGSWGLWQVI